MTDKLTEDDFYLHPSDTYEKLRIEILGKNVDKKALMKQIIQALEEYPKLKEEIARKDMIIDRKIELIEIEEKYSEKLKAEIEELKKWNQRNKEDKEYWERELKKTYQNYLDLQQKATQGQLLEQKIKEFMDWVYSDNWNPLSTKTKLQQLLNSSQGDKTS